MLREMFCHCIFSPDVALVRRPDRRAVHWLDRRVSRNGTASDGFDLFRAAATCSLGVARFFGLLPGFSDRSARTFVRLAVGEPCVDAFVPLDLESFRHCSAAQVLSATAATPFEIATAYRNPGTAIAAVVIEALTLPAGYRGSSSDAYNIPGSFTSIPMSSAIRLSECGIEPRDVFPMSLNVVGSFKYARGVISSLTQLPQRCRRSHAHSSLQVENSSRSQRGSRRPAHFAARGFQEASGTMLVRYGPAEKASCRTSGWPYCPYKRPGWGRPPSCTSMM